VGHAAPVHARGAETRTVAPTWTSKGVGARSSRARASDADASERAAGTLRGPATRPPNATRSVRRVAVPRARRHAIHILAASSDVVVLIRSLVPKTSFLKAVVDLEADEKSRVSSRRFGLVHCLLHESRCK
jgi:hypothetical protein